jgi:hypothetical protein
MCEFCPTVGPCNMPGCEGPADPPAFDPITRTNRVEIHYAYPTSEMATKLRAERGGFYVTVGCLVVSPLFLTIHGAEGFCRNNCLTWEPHPFPLTSPERSLVS